jgi:predicted nucleic acid-binding protein
LGILLDTSVLIGIERTLGRSSAEARLDDLAGLLPTEAEMGISAVTASELLHGVHRANSARRPAREAYVEAVLRTFPAFPFDLPVARIHGHLWADLAAGGIRIGPHDLIVAATAIAKGWAVATLNGKEFCRVPGLTVIEPDLA